jgi:uncharacterized damage-inducible protein DinB
MIALYSDEKSGEYVKSFVVSAVLSSQAAKQSKMRQKGKNRMNRYMQEKWPWIEGTHGMRSLLIDSLSDADLAFNPGGQNMSLGALCREMGEIEHSYIQSLKTLQQDWSYHNTETGLENSVAQIKAWYQTLDEEMKATVSALSDEDLTKTVDRGGSFVMPVELQLDVYLQALLIFFGKATVFLKAMNKALPENFQEVIG